MGGGNGAIGTALLDYIGTGEIHAMQSVETEVMSTRRTWTLVGGRYTWGAQGGTHTVRPSLKMRCKGSGGHEPNRTTLNAQMLGPNSRAVHKCSSTRSMQRVVAWRQKTMPSFSALYTQTAARDCHHCDETPVKKWKKTKQFAHEKRYNLYNAAQSPPQAPERQQYILVLTCPKYPPPMYGGVVPRVTCQQNKLPAAAAAAGPRAVLRTKPSV